VACGVRIASGSGIVRVEGVVAAAATSFEAANSTTRNVLDVLGARVEGGSGSRPRRDRRDGASYACFVARSTTPGQVLDRTAASSPATASGTSTRGRAVGDDGVTATNPTPDKLLDAGGAHIEPGDGVGHVVTVEAVQATGVEGGGPTTTADPRGGGGAGAAGATRAARATWT